MMRLLRPPHIGIFLRSFHSHSTHYARETIAEIWSMWDALATAIISQTGSCGDARGGPSRPALDAAAPGLEVRAGLDGSSHVAVDAGSHAGHGRGYLGVEALRSLGEGASSAL